MFLQDMAALAEDAKPILRGQLVCGKIGIASAVRVVVSKIVADFLGQTLACSNSMAMPAFFSNGGLLNWPVTPTRTDIGIIGLQPCK
jgi:hypothetical protein